MARRSMHDVRPLLDLLRDTVEAAGPGPTLADLPVSWEESTGRALADAAHDLGLLPVMPAVVGADGDRGAAASRRHLALFVRSRADAGCVARCVKWLARRSPRGHVVLRFASGGPRGVRSGVPRASGAHEDDQRLATLIEHIEFERADAWLAALHTEAGLLGRPLRDRTLMLETWLRLWQARHEEAEAACHQVRDEDGRRLLDVLVAWATCRAGARVAGVAPARWQAVGAAARFVDLVRIDTHLARGAFTPARVGFAALAGSRPGTPLARRARDHFASLLEPQASGTRDRPVASLSSAGLSRWKHGAVAMYLLPAVPLLMQLLADADDEVTALRAAARWAQEHAGARGVAFVGGDEACLVAAEGWAGQAPPAADRLLAVNARAPEQHARGPLVLALAPVRYAGARTGGVLVAGPAARSGTLAEAAATLALLCASALRLRLDQLAALRQTRATLPEVIGDSPAAAAMREAVVRAAAAPFAVLVEGESGTGKELVARALHRLSARRDRRFVAVNCAALSDDLVEAELFGHSRGAFTGAVAPRAGLVEDAHGGTLFLDEVAELSARAQAKLLRVLQEREVRRVGENAARAVDVRIVAATNRPLAEASAAGHFREDLLFRLAVVRIRLAPLRERTEDIAPLVRSFWSRTVRDVDKRAVLGADALARLATHHWPGNVRELQNVVSGLALIAPVRGRVSSRHVEQVLADAGCGRQPPPMSLERARHLCERLTVTTALARHAGRRSAAARELGLTRQGLAKIIRRLHISDPVIEGVA
jgi:DNA-binding NtrC family response regulator